VVSSSELVRPDVAKIGVVALDAVHVTGAYDAAGHRTNLSISVLTAAGAPVSFRSFRLNVTVGLRARLKTAPDAPLGRIVDVAQEVTFTNADTVVLPIADALILDAAGHPGYRLGPEGHDPHVEWVVQASAYPALKPGTAAVTLGIS
jgi:hypothetical protein